MMAVSMDTVRAAAGGRLQLPSVPRVVRRLISQLRDPATSIVEVVDELEQEPQLAARTLRIANSPYYCGRRSLASLKDAVAIIGTDTLRTLVISGGLEAVFVAVPGVNLRQFWLDATLTAKAARSLARLAGGDGEAAFLAGLLHNVGHLILCQAFADRLPAVLAGSRQARGRALAALEHEACGLDHAQVSAAWLDELGFPTAVIDAVARHLEADPAAGTLAPVLALATQVAASIEGGDKAELALQKLDASLVAAASLVADNLGERFGPQYEQIAAGSEP
ncbi:HDOD domain-containing protein [Roseateles cellulosilyticus]|uniref:HDOD domain-containing protein n=1 Tax=Pelomonas cellulosilytica TaxID=2906762 RepID=A0ABS8XRP3_9BURK|nr:HDOD domain-containing protein [Pelomonas sp. P8]MCE4553516.1 HDOD domain-containing protein [Pelomonas sp. P8]